MDLLILMLSLVAGVAGTGLGGIIGVLLKNRGARVMGRVLGFAGGVMAGVVAFEMIPEAIASTVFIGKIGGIAAAVATTVGGMLVIFAINKLLDLIEKKKSNKVRVFSGIESSPKQRRSMLKAGVVMLIAIALHNFPEGMAIGAAGTLETHMGVLIALIIAVHNVPEGVAISAPLVSGGVNAIKTVVLTALAGGATVVGALVGLLVGGLGEVATGVCLALASGAMLYVTFCDILPQSIVLNDGEVPSISMLAGLVFSIIFVFAF